METNEACCKRALELAAECARVGHTLDGGPMCEMAQLLGMVSARLEIMAKRLSDSEVAR